VAVELGEFAMDAALVLTPDADYVSGGTPLGIVASMHVVGFEKDVELLTRVHTGSHETDARITAIRLTYQVVLLEQSNKLMDLMFGVDADTYEGMIDASQKLGLLDDAEYSKLIVRPFTATKPHLYLPRALVTAIGPIVYHTTQKAYEAALLTIKALLDPDILKPFMYGDPASFGPQVPEEE
jgi:hypothetical protein